MSDNGQVDSSGILESTDKQRQVAIFALLAVTLVWGATFIRMKQALDAQDEEKTMLGTNGVVACILAVISLVSDSVLWLYKAVSP